MTGHIKVGGTWREASEIHVKVGGAWRDVQEGYVKVGGTWRQFFNSTLLIDPGSLVHASSTFGATDRSGIRIDTSKDIIEIRGPNSAPSSVDNGDDWLLPAGTASDYEVRFTYTVGSPDGGDSAGVWHTLSVDRETYIQAAAGSVNATVTVDIRRIAATSDSVSFSVSLSSLVI